MVYLDTSAVVPLFVHEPASDAVDRWLSSCKEALAASDWLVTEFASALAIKTRNQQITTQQAKRAWVDFELFIEGGVRLLPVSRTAFHEAARLVREKNSTLRSGDALHIAAAFELGAASMATLDLALGENAVRLGLVVEPIVA